MRRPGRHNCADFAAIEESIDTIAIPDGLIEFRILDFTNVSGIGKIHMAAWEMSQSLPMKSAKYWTEPEKTTAGEYFPCRV
jgi:hypothetical protein